MECPKCDDRTEMVKEMGFRDCFNYTAGHYTVDVPILVCPKCEYVEDLCEAEEEVE